MACCSDCYGNIHIAHMNLRDQYLPYRHLIGQVILDKSPNIKTVVNKLETIDNTYRNFKMEVIAGEERFVALVKENGCQFKFDFSKVYWNSRLHAEHERIISCFESDQLICDAMAGVGPFAIPAAKNKKCVVWANDLNPASYSALNDNIALNKVGNLVKPFNQDARGFIRQAFAELASSEMQHSPSRQQIRSFDHVVMNLPGTAIEFLDAFRGLYRDYRAPNGSDSSPALPEVKLPILHVHCFSNKEDRELDVKQRACAAMGIPTTEHESLNAEVIH
ncbi:tRNA(m(1)G37)methyltransferase, partial [Spiromyces aspiralis]